MSSFHSPCNKEQIRLLLLDVGASAVGFATAMPVDDEAEARYSQWLALERNAGMDYMAKYPDVRHDPRLLLDGARTLIVTAFNYTPRRRQPQGAPRIADYALGDDYHEVIRARLNSAADTLKRLYGGETRVCVDTAPLRERYWATRAGIGFIGLNNQLIVPSVGSNVFIGTLIWTGEVDPDTPSTDNCNSCGACIKACPAKALFADGAALDARRCLSYLTIEHRGPLPDGLHTGGRLYGCDVCREVCPHNRCAQPTDIDEFTPSDLIMSLTADNVAAMDTTAFNAAFRHSAVRRTKLAGLIRNLQHL